MNRTRRKTVSDFRSFGMKKNRRRMTTGPENASTRFKELEEMLYEKKRQTVRDLEEQLGRQLSPDLRERIRTALDAGDQSTLDLFESIDLSLLEMKNQTLKNIERAIRRVKDRSYGNCEECGVEIPNRRLMAIPFARTCIACQEKRELIEKIGKKEEDYP
jgi:RNA polymerase-binding transcription factor